MTLRERDLAHDRVPFCIAGSIPTRKADLMAQVKVGDTVKAHYKGTLENGTVFDNSNGRDPIEFEVGSGKVIPGFEKAVVGMEPGDKKTVTIAVGDAYGDRRDELLLEVPKEQVPPDLDANVGDDLVLERNGQEIRVRVQDVNDAGMTLDANHPLAGEELTFEIELVEIV
jgi:peptidylprolyl isomerase